jgi:hypothetical protein
MKSKDTDRDVSILEVLSLIMNLDYNVCKISKGIPYMPHLIQGCNNPLPHHTTGKRGVLE